MSPCGCQTACGCNIIAGVGVSVQRIGDDFYVSSSAYVPVVQLATTDTVISPETTIVIFDGDAASELELPPALAGGLLLHVWNLDPIDNVTVVAAVGDTINGDPDILLTAAQSATFVSAVDGAWIAVVA